MLYLYLSEPKLKNCTHLTIAVMMWFEKVQGGSRRFAALELPHTNSYTPCTPCFPSKDVVRAGSAQSNHPEPMLKNSTHLTKAVMLWFEKVLGGSMRWNYPTLLFKHPAHLAAPLQM